MRFMILKILTVYVIIGLGLIPASTAISPITVDGIDTDWDTLNPLYEPFKFDVEDKTRDLSFNPGTGSIDISYGSGFDLEIGSVFIDILDYPNVSLYFKIVPNGTVGDATGEGNPRTGSFVIDSFHTVFEDDPNYDMGSDEKYEIRFDYNNDDIPDEKIIIGDEDQVYWDSDGTSTGLSAHWIGRVLEVGAVNVGAHSTTLSELDFRFDMYAGSAEDYWSEDRLPNIPTEPPEADFEFLPSCQGWANFSSTSNGHSPIVWLEWNFGDGNIIAGGDPAPSHQYAPGGTYSVTLTVTNLWGLTDEITKDITVGKGAVKVEAGPDKSILLGDCVTIGGSPTASEGESPYYYTWFGAGLSDPTNIANPSACPTTTTTYKVEVEDNNSYFDKSICYGSDEIRVTVLGPDISLTKHCPSSAIVGEVITYKYTVENTGDSDLTNVVLVDDKATPIIKSKGNGDEILSPGEKWEYTATYTITETTINTAIVTAVDVLTQTEVSDNDRCTTPTDLSALSTMGLITMAGLLGIIMAFSVKKKK